MLILDQQSSDDRKKPTEEYQIVQLPTSAVTSSLPPVFSKPSITAGLTYSPSCKPFPFTRAAIFLSPSLTLARLLRKYDPVRIISYLIYSVVNTRGYRTV